ncbi:MAG: ribonuclease P protein component [Melioribacteraceae bacterium]|nr:ribonuclease P protein component [Melioribacteraceae bacterium]
MKQFGLSKKERIKRKKEFDFVFSNGEYLFSPDKTFKAVFYVLKETEEAVLQAAFAVSKKAGIAVWRNRVKRLMRESFRLNKNILLPLVAEKKYRIQIIFSPLSINYKNSKNICLKNVMPQIVDIMNQIKEKI